MVDGFLPKCPPCSRYCDPGCVPPIRGGAWGRPDGRFMTRRGLDYLELCRATMSQFDRGARPAIPASLLQRANTQECGMQVTATMQCSLGPKTLSGQARELPGASMFAQNPGPRFGPPGKWQYETPPRFLRPVSTNPFDPRLSRDRWRDREAEAAGHDESVRERPASQGSEDTGKNLPTSFRHSTKGAISQFLEQRYGFFHCKKCNIRWESAYVWCISGTCKVYYKQLCRRCREGTNPFKVDPILCKKCGLASCYCDKKHRHIHMERPHRQDLCSRCKSMRLSCDSTCSFKYTL